MSNSDQMTSALPGGLRFRLATPADLQQIGELLVRRGAPDDALDHRLVVEDPDEGYRSSAVVVDGDRVVSTATLLDETVRLDDVVLAAGQVELVATDTEYEGRGLVRALMGWAHAESARRGHLLGVMVGIPYFYRLFGYEYALHQPFARKLTALPAAAAGEALRRATTADIPALAALQDAAQRVSDCAVPHPPARWRWLLAQSASRTWVVERAGRVVASARTKADDGLMAEAAALDPVAAASLVRGVADLTQDGRLRVVERPGTVVHELCAPLMAPAPEVVEQYYVRIPDVAALLEALRPVLSRRLAATGLDRVGKDVLLSTFRRHFRLSVTAGGLGPVEAGGVCASPGDMGGAAVAPDWLPALIFGPAGMAGLARLRPDVYPGPDAELYTALFPPVSADVLSYYLPY